jgi:hypothetical protein
MNGYELIMRIQQKMQDPVFAAKFNQLVKKLNSIPGLQQEVMRIVKIEDPKKRQKAMEKLPSGVKNSVEEMMKLLSEH